MSWTQIGLDIDGENQNAGDQSGYSVSLSANGSRVAIGAPFNDANATNLGHVRVYEWNDMTLSWGQMGADINGENSLDQSGWSVSLSANGSRVAIGAIGNDGENGTDSGHVRVYDWNGTLWTQVGLDIDGEVAFDNSGFSVSLSADGLRVAIGANRNDNVNGSNSGHVRVYDWNGTASPPAWEQVGLDIDGENAEDFSGHSVSLSADGLRVAIGANRNDGNWTNSGHVRIYELFSGAWTQVGIDIDGEFVNDQSGYSVSLSADGSRVAIGAIQNDGDTKNIDDNRGHVRVYELITPSSGSGSSYPKSTGRIIGADGVPKGKLILNAKSGLSASSYTFTICLNNEVYGEDITLKYNTVLPLSVGCDIDIADIMSRGTYQFEVLGLTVDNGWTKIGDSINNINVDVFFKPNNSKIGCLYKGTLDVIFYGPVMYCDIIVCIAGQFSLHPCKVIHGCENYCIHISKQD